MSQSLVPLKLDQTQLANVWKGMSTSQKVGLGAVVTAALTALIFFLAWAQTPEYATAFTDVDPKDGAAIVTYLKENSIPYELDNGGATIRVPAKQVYDVRLALAGEGLPGQATIGFEIFDTASLGMTDFTQQVNYQRALEGELGRTISEMTPIKSARVHIVIPQPTLFSEQQEKTTASVVLELETGQQLNKEQVQAISHLVSSAVEGLAKENLTIVDLDGNVLSSGDGTDAGLAALSVTQIETQRQLEQDLVLRIKTLLNNVLGPDMAVVGVAADMNWDQVETQNELYTPAEQGGSVIRSSRAIVENSSSNNATAGGIPGTASNIPDAAASYQTAISGTNGSGYQTSDVTTNYEISKSTSHIVSATGEIKRLSVSVLVNNITDTVVLDTIRAATIAAAGIDETRGDVVTVSSMPFERGYILEQEAAMDASRQQEFYLLLARWAIVGIALVAMFFVVRGMQRSLRLRQVEVLPQEQRSPVRLATSGAGQLDPREALLQRIAVASTEDEIAAGIAELSKIGPPSFDADQQEAAAKAQMVRQLQLVAKNKPETLAQVIQFWMSED